MNYKKLILKAVVTFVESAGAYLIAANGINKAALIGALGSAFSFVWNTVFYPALLQKFPSLNKTK